MSQIAPQPCSFDSQSFVLRMRVEQKPPRIWVRIEHVNQGQVRQFSGIDAALTHLGEHMKALSKDPNFRLQKEFPDV